MVAVVEPKNGLLKHIISKTQKVKGAIEFDITESPVLTGIVQRCQLVDTLCHKLLVLPDGRPVTYRMISSRREEARDAAAYRAEVTDDTERGKQIHAMYLRDMRSFAASPAEEIDAASKLLEHSNLNVTRKHYRTRATRLEAVRRS